MALKRNSFWILVIALFPLMAWSQKAWDGDGGVKVRMRVIIDNDLSGDPDGLFQLVHHVLSPSVDIRGVIGSHLNQQAGFDNQGNSAASACKKAREVLQLLGRQDIPVVEGSPVAMSAPDKAQPSDGARLIVKEALRTDTKLPLFVVCGASLTNIASAWLINPEIADHLILIWIGGQEYSGMPMPPGGTPVEYNLGLSVNGARCVFNLSNLKLWQVPRYAYRQCIYSLAEMKTDVAPCGEIGHYLYSSIVNMMRMISDNWLGSMGEAYVLGDSPLVLLTALQTGFEAAPASCHYRLEKAPHLSAEGLYESNPNGREIRVYDWLDTRLMFQDMVSKLRLFTR